MIHARDISCDQTDGARPIFSPRLETADLRPLLKQLLPDQGSIEIHRDVAGKEHAWHRHGADETLVILDGYVRFYWDQGERLCGPGTMISLPAGTMHGTVALEGGATYAIAFHQVNLPQYG